jgi:hypothetical protein
MDDQPDYSKLEELLFRGFLTSKCEIGEVPLVLKTINQNERKKIMMKSGIDDESTIPYQIAYSIFLFDGINVLSKRDELIPILVKEIENLPERVLTHIIISLTHLNKQAIEEIDHVEPYSYGDKSRSNWILMEDKKINDPAVTGIQGTDRLGLNSHQQMWISLNKVEDKREKYERDWEIAAFQASAWNSEGIKKARRKKEDKAKERKRKREKIYKTKGKSDIEEDKKEIHLVQESPQELLDQMERDNEGVKDYHDKVVEEHERQIREEVIEEEKNWQKKKQEARKKRQEKMSDVSSDDPFVVFDKDDAEEYSQKQEMQREHHKEEGNYTDRSDFERRVEQFQKWGIVEGKDKLKETGKERVEKYQNSEEVSNGENSESSDSPESVEGTVLEDHYRSVNEDLNNPEEAELPDIYDEE